MPCSFSPSLAKNESRSGFSDVVDVQAVDIRASAPCLGCGKYPQSRIAIGWFLTNGCSIRLFSPCRVLACLLRSFCCVGEEVRTSTSRNTCIVGSDPKTDEENG